MQKIVSITSQGQITIPAVMQRQLGIKQFKKALVRVENKKIVVEPLPDFINLAGALAKKANKRKKIDELIKIEEEIILKMKK
jgi:bifunctional DNA-binding transcriptional regulator/antitoxin component of YhaV-PrlF toxin-antitoxin module